MADIQIVPYSPEYHDALLELQQRLWSPSLALNASYFRWKYIDNPHARIGGVSLAVSDNRVVGMRGCMGTVWTDPHGAGVPIPLMGDTVVAADYEGRGIVARLGRASRSEFAGRGVGFFLATSSTPLTYWHSRRAGWEPVGRYTRMRRRSRHYWRHKLRRELRRTGLFPVAPASDPIAALDGADWRLDRKTVVSLRSSIDCDAFADLCARTRPDSKYSLLRDAAFLRWRFANPFFKYYFLTCREDAALAAYLVISVEKRGSMPDITIVDWQSVDWKHFRQLLDILARRIPGTYIRILANAFTGAERQDLVEAGFSDVVHKDDRVSRRVNYEPGVLAISTVDAVPVEAPVRTLVEKGFELLDFKGIESDGA